MKTILMAAVSIDGKIAEKKNASVTWTSKEDKKLFKNATQKAGVVVFGRKTFEIDLKKNPLPDRLNVVMTHNPSAYTDIPDSLEFSSDTPQNLLKTIEQKGFKQCVIGGGEMVYSLFLNTKCVDEIHLTVEPIIFGKGVSLFGSDTNQIPLTLKSVEKFGKDELLVKYLTS